MGKANLHFPRADRVAQHAEHLNCRHGVSIQLQRADLVVLMIQQHQQQKVRLSALPCIVSRRLALLVNAHQQQLGHAHAFRIGLALIRHLLALTDLRLRHAAFLALTVGLNAGAHCVQPSRHQQHRRDRRRASSPADFLSSPLFLSHAVCRTVSFLAASGRTSSSVLLFFRTIFPFFSTTAMKKAPPPEKFRGDVRLFTRMSYSRPLTLVADLIA